MINIEDYKQSNGNIDWTTFRKAQVSAGEICSQCSKYLIRIIDSSFGPALCGACKSLETTPGPVRHSTFIRCPKCRESFDPSPWEDSWAFQEGSHNINCPNCDHKFEITVEVQFSYESPKLVGENQDESRD